METVTITSTLGDVGAGNLQRIQPSANSGRRRQQPQRRRKPTSRETTEYREVTYTPDGHFESDEYGHRVDISA